MSTIHEPGRDIPIVANTDVLVVGGGTAGLPAALAAARSGLDVMVLDRYGYVGGASAGGLVITLPKDRQGVITAELEERLLEVGGAAILDDDWLAWCPETFKWLGLKMLEEAGAQMLFHCWCVECVMDGNSIDSVIIESKAGRQAIKAKMFVDCTGDADLAAFAGAPYTKGDISGAMAPVTMMFMMSNVDEEQYKDSKPLNPPPRHMHSRITSIYSGHLNIWGGRISDIDGTDPFDITKAENQLRKQVFEWYYWAKENMPGCEESYISMTSPQVGIRETRLIQGEYHLSKSDWDNKTMFEDHVGFAYVDKSIPYRSILPQKVENLLVGGRCVSYDRDILDPMRLIPPCMVTGYAAGMAAAISIREDTLPHYLNINKLQKSLQENGVEFPRK